MFPRQAHLNYRFPLYDRMGDRVLSFYNSWKTFRPITPLKLSNEWWMLKSRSLISSFAYQNVWHQSNMNIKFHNYDKRELYRSVDISVVIPTRSHRLLGTFYFKGSDLCGIGIRSDTWSHKGWAIDFQVHTCACGRVWNRETGGGERERERERESMHTNWVWVHECVYGYVCREIGKQLWVVFRRIMRHGYRKGYMPVNDCLSRRS